jgi:uroporphyrinogen decarboxylase
VLFDTWGGVLTPAQYDDFSLRHLAEVVDALTRKADGGDWTTDLAEARHAVEGRVAVLVDTVRSHGVEAPRA